MILAKYNSSYPYGKLRKGVTESPDVDIENDSIMKPPAISLHVNRFRAFVVNKCTDLLGLSIPSTEFHLDAFSRRKDFLESIQLKYGLFSTFSQVMNSFKIGGEIVENGKVIFLGSGFILWH